MEAGARQDLEGDDDVDGTVRLVDDVLNEQRWEGRLPQALPGHRKVAAAFAELRVDAKAGVQFPESVEHGAAVARVDGPAYEGP